MKFISKPKVFGIFVTLTLLFSILFTYASNVQADLADNMLRLHILANSDSTADQQLKLKVRDRILAETGTLFSSSRSPLETICLARDNSDHIKAIAEDEIRKCGYSYGVTVFVGKFDFPTKTYDDITLPSGSYNAVRIVIGNGKGHNWWCVMFPPLCFVNGVAKIPDNARSQLKKTLSADEYKLITKSDSMPVEIKFKLVEAFNSFKK